LQWQNYKENYTALPGIGEGHLFVSSSDVADSPGVVTWSYVASSLISIEQQEDCFTIMVPRQQSSSGRLWLEP